MGYSIYIGNGALELLEEEEEYETPYSRVINGRKRYFKMRVRQMKLDAAPVFPNDEMTGNGNSRHPGYTSWSHFCNVTGLGDLFFNEEHGLMREHPGYAQLDKNHAQIIKSALNNWKAKYPNSIPGFEAFSWDGRNRTITNVGYDPILARLIWLDWWVSWALKHCEHAGIYNF